ncbi:hypothetical protein Zm00014a_009013 [Zea mays]|jgi:hypothetical protein|uniref:Uncharacterized protein n=1 Tax=Zea mays TaxID=4577 RepID=A0A317Y595_MAIZE|nr:hypothetical protein Zm00014a_009013 [Zea mays]
MLRTHKSFANYLTNKLQVGFVPTLAWNSVGYAEVEKRNESAWC